MWISFFTTGLFLFCVKPANTQRNVVEAILSATRDAMQTPFNTISDTKEFEKEYDFVIIGAGSSGSVLANRLTEEAAWEVLLLEAGREEIFLTDVPLASTYMTFTDYNWGYKTQPGTTACLGMDGNRCSWPRGKGLGGTSLINYMVYTRGNRKDYDQWADLGNESWSYRDVLPYFKKSERIDIKEMKDSPYRGKDGYLSVTYAPWRSPLAKAQLQAAEEKGYEVNDPNAERQIGASFVQANLKNGRRQSAAKAFIRPVRHRSNLHVAKNARATRIVIDPKTNITLGVEFVKNRMSYFVRVKKEVLLSAGTLNSPQLLMLSGVGPKRELQKHNITVIRDLPVGENLQDHVSFAGLLFLINQTVSIIDSRVSSNPINALNYILRNKGPMTSPGGAEVLIFMKTRSPGEFPEIPDDVPDMELAFGAGSLAGDTSGGLRKTYSIKDEIFEAVLKPVLGKDSFGIVPVLLKPRSRGRVRLKSSNPYHWPLFYHGYYSHEDDMRTMVRGIKAVSKTSLF